MTIAPLARPIAATLFGLGLSTMGMPQLAQASKNDPAPVSAYNRTDSLAFDLAAGEVLELVLPKQRFGWEERKARRTFETIVLPHMEKQAFEFHGSLGIKDAVIGQTKPSAVEFYSYESAKSKRALEETQGWKELQDFRSEGWKRRDIFSTAMTENVSLNFDPDKYYTLAIAWTNPANPDDYDLYLDGVETEFASVGARFVHRFRSIDYKTQSGDRKLPPAQLIFVEWDAADGLDRLLTSDAYRQHSPKFRSGVSDFRLYRLASPDRS